MQDCFDYHVVSGYLQEEAAWEEIRDWVEAAIDYRVLAM